MTVTQSWRHGLLVLHLSHLTPHRNEHKLIPVELQILVVFSDDSNIAQITLH